MKTVTEGKTKLVYFEAMRIIAVFFVIFNHTGDNGFLLFSCKEAAGVPFWVDLSLSVFCKVAVPLFFAISGALMLNKENEPLADLWRKRICKYIMIICLFILCNYFAEALLSGEPLNWEFLFASVYEGWFWGKNFWFGHLWYLYAYIAYLICLPFLRSLVRNLDTKYFYYMIGIALFFCALLPVVECFLFQGATTLYGDIKPSWIWQRTVLYPCIGYFLEHRVDIEKQKKNLLRLWILNGIGIAVSCYLVYSYEQITGKINEGLGAASFEIFNLLNCMTVFLTVKYGFTHIRIPQWLERGILSVGKCTFGIYLIHVMVLESPPMNRLLAGMTRHGINSMLACLMQCAAVMVICYGITYVLLKIPFVKKFVGG